MGVNELANVKLTLSLPEDVDAYIRSQASPRRMGDFVAMCVRAQMNPEPGKGLLERIDENLAALVEQKGGKA